MVLLLWLEPFWLFHPDFYFHAGTVSRGEDLTEHRVDPLEGVLGDRRRAGGGPLEPVFSWGLESQLLSACSYTMMAMGRAC